MRGGPEQRCTPQRVQVAHVLQAVPPAGSVLASRCCFLLHPLQPTCSQVFEVAGILLSPHSQRLRNAIHACLPGQAVRLHDMLQASWFGICCCCCLAR